eukprot:GHVL01017930.1.p1 GENE.GHVL01017930.1~~GHVL01017930.1.p1  ORF type:complete len:129 (-),score=20.43 GHVL01017930.1:145-531(-)
MNIRSDHIVALCVVKDSVPAVLNWARVNGIGASRTPSNIAKIVNSPEFTKAVFLEMACALQKAGALPFEKLRNVNKIHIEYNLDFPEKWIEGIDIDGKREQLLTATLKARRTQLDIYWEDMINKLYSQ